MNSRHETPFHAAIMHESRLGGLETSINMYEVIKLLLGQGANIRAVDEETRVAVQAQLATYIASYAGTVKDINEIQNKYLQKRVMGALTNQSFYKSVLLDGVSANNQVLSEKSSKIKDQVSADVGQWFKQDKSSKQEDLMVGPSFRK